MLLRHSLRSGGISQQIRGARLREELDGQSQQEQYHDPDRYSSSHRDRTSVDLKRDGQRSDDPTASRPR
ncbi:hypothetical protein C8039_07035 [Halogeometricum sp. wsp3]|nr:hypothetical protein C8039_07035 [Halogeometricum sp. wsp3]